MNNMECWNAWQPNWKTKQFKMIQAMNSRWSGHVSYAFTFVQKSTQFPINRNYANVQIQSLNSNSTVFLWFHSSNQNFIFNSPLAWHNMYLTLCPNFVLAQKYKFKIKAKQSYVNECSRIWNVVVKMPRR